LLVLSPLFFMRSIASRKLPVRQYVRLDSQPATAEHQHERLLVGTFLLHAEY
jgi:hypothetical protein